MNLVRVRLSNTVKAGNGAKLALTSESGCQHQSSSSKQIATFHCGTGIAGHIPGCPSSSSSTSTASGSSTT
nr:BPK_HP1_G0042720.mRNA.1.CDS.1 [Saccharomyces cerevisiae]